jgi:hypothetical protein
MAWAAVVYWREKRVSSVGVYGPRQERVGRSRELCWCVGSGLCDCALGGRPFVVHSLTADSVRATLRNFGGVATRLCRLRHQQEAYCTAKVVPKHTHCSWVTRGS